MGTGKSSQARIIDDIAELVAIPSVSSTDPGLDMPNEAIVAKLAAMLEHGGFRTQAMAVPGQPGKFNLVASYGDGPGGLILSGHTDTVPYDADLWNTDPFALTESDDRLYGLGSTDMKAFFALALAAARRFDAADLGRRLVVIATADEESGMSGARALTEGESRLADVALIGEPTDLRPIRLHKGILMERVTLSGRSGHSSDPSLGVSALEGMVAVINALQDFRTRLQQHYSDDHFPVSVPTMNFGRIAGGDNPNRICGECHLDLDCRFLPGMDLDDIRKQIHARVTNCVAGSGLEVRFHPILHGIDAMNTPADSSFVRAVEDLTGLEAGGVAFATEAPFYAQQGVDVVVAGPGSIDQAHQPDEYVSMSQLEPTIELLHRVIGRYCVDVESDGGKRS